MAPYVCSEHQAKTSNTLPHNNMGVRHSPVSGTTANASIGPSPSLVPTDLTTDLLVRALARSSSSVVLEPTLVGPAAIGAGNKVQHISDTQGCEGDVGLECDGGGYIPDEQCNRDYIAKLDEGLATTNARLAGMQLSHQLVTLELIVAPVAPYTAPPPLYTVPASTLPDPVTKSTLPRSSALSQGTCRPTFLDDVNNYNNALDTTTFDAFTKSVDALVTWGYLPSSAGIRIGSDQFGWEEKGVHSQLYLIQAHWRTKPSSALLQRHFLQASGQLDITGGLPLPRDLSRRCHSFQTVQPLKQSIVHRPQLRCCVCEFPPPARVSPNPELAQCPSSLQLHC
ncbi:hypothetical protein BDK51DRAFT_43712 [Blyttiomyces helicus]|uniref:Uncharacterized protein n=1 Tax=Blyttiomyces helicus TaxID=388810 RepID=A0A4P9WJY6_9FUNG|nr:hypothetical protein BDK51DRAFT_43712 [Blyttiomyces helicus]|eukprot:RKO92283.1 hypothetical protein BDK51DRAFT_43712 [Blyttiomyces helicus]